jgi:hypothetical protein
VIFTAGSCIIGDNDTAYETLVGQLGRNTAISGVNVTVNIIFVPFIFIFMIYVFIILKSSMLYSRIASWNES